MLGALIDLARPMLFALDGEQAHEVTLRALEAGIYPRNANDSDARLKSELWGLGFPNPIGIAAGFDKDARVPDAVLAMGLGFTEVGTATPKPQAGNPRPRIFRLIAERAIINRLGFNNGGHDAALKRLKARRQQGIVGVNIGANKDTADRGGDYVASDYAASDYVASDYVAGLRAFNDVASYFMINISSPNTPGLRDLQAPAALDELLGRLMTARRDLVAAGGPQRPIIVKLAPDIAQEDLAAITDRLVAHGVDGIAVSNTTLARPGLAGVAGADETGGLSGRPLFHRSTVMLARVYQLTGGRIPLIGIGGISSGETALAKIRAGASLIQLYTGLVFGGSGLIRDMQSHLSAHVAEHGFASIADAIGLDAEIWAAKPIDE